MNGLNEYWFPWVPSRYKADTMHLSALQDGIYRRLIDHYMETKSPLSDNDMALARIAGVAPEEFAPHSQIIRAFFTKATGKLQLKKCDGILADQAGRQKSYSERGRKGGRGKVNKIKGEKATALLKPTTLHNNTIQVEDTTQLARAHDSGGFRKIYDEGSSVFPALATRNTGSITKWLEAGADPDLDVLPEIRRAVGKNIRSWNYFDGQVMDAMATRLKPLPQGKANETTLGNNPKPHGNKSERAKAAIFEGLGLSPQG